LLSYAISIILFDIAYSNSFSSSSIPIIHIIVYIEWVPHLSKDIFEKSGTNFPNKISL